MFQAPGNGTCVAPRRGAVCLRTLMPLALGALLMSGCMTARIEELREAPTQIKANEAIVLLAKPHLEGTGTEEKFLDCLERKLVGEEFSATVAYKQRQGKNVEPRSNSKKSPFQIYADHHFVDALYPWLEPSTAPANAQGFAAFLARPGVAERVNEMGVRYIVWIDGVTQKTDGGGSIACAAGPGGAGCLGLGWWEKSSGLRSDGVGFAAGRDRRDFVDRRERHVGDDRSDRADPAHRAGAEHGVRSLGHPAQVVLVRERIGGNGLDLASELIAEHRERVAFSFCLPSELNRGAGDGSNVLFPRRCAQRLFSRRVAKSSAGKRARLSRG